MAKRVPKKAVARADKKIVAMPSQPAASTPSWRFSKVDCNGPFPWPSNTDTEQQIIQKLRLFDSMTWKEIEGPDHHAIGVESLSKDAQDRLREIKLDDQDEIFSFHFQGKPRIIGIREFNVVRLLWWDPEHGVCPSKKKHT